MNDEELAHALAPLRSQWTCLSDICEVLLEVLPVLVQENQELRERVQKLEGSVYD